MNLIGEYHRVHLPSPHSPVSKLKVDRMIQLFSLPNLMFLCALNAFLSKFVKLVDGLI